jgi:hypothetical protein
MIAWAGSQVRRHPRKRAVTVPRPSNGVGPATKPKVAAPGRRNNHESVLRPIAVSGASYAHVPVCGHGSPRQAPERASPSEEGEHGTDEWRARGGKQVLWSMPASGD